MGLNHSFPNHVLFIGHLRRLLALAFMNLHAYFCAGEDYASFGNSLMTFRLSAQWWLHGQPSGRLLGRPGVTLTGRNSACGGVPQKPDPAPLRAPVSPSQSPCPSPTHLHLQQQRREEEETDSN